MTTGKEISPPEITYLSLGWGVQSFTLAAMAALGDLEGLDVAVHADTQHEAQATYDFARRWMPWLEEHGVKVVTVKAPKPNVITYPNRTGNYTVQIPAFTLNKEDGKIGQVKRQCTKHWKIMPLRRYIRSLLVASGRPRPGAIESWQGISLDEFQRMRTSDVQYIVNRYPLVDARLTRKDCVTYLEEHKLEVPPKSACVFCPFHNRDHWKDMKRRGGADWKHAIEIDKEVRSKRLDKGFDLFIHPLAIPLQQAVMLPEDMGGSQRALEFEFDQPCDGGVCFV